MKHIVGLGDSLAYGAGDESGSGGIMGRLSDELHARGLSGVDAINLGVNGATSTDLSTRLGQKRVQDEVSRADAVVLSIGANDLFRSQHSREEILRNPLGIAQRILEKIAAIVVRIHSLTPRAHVLVLGGYNPVPRHEWAPLINQYLGMWDQALAHKFASDSRVSVVKMSDLATPQRLSRHDSFHPGAKAYEAAAKRIADMLIARAA
jgi:lysophospholipase L1-like esterase